MTVRKAGRSYVSEVHEFNGKQYHIPMNPTLREMADFVDKIGVKTYEDEQEMRFIRYESLFEPAPPSNENRILLEEADAALSRLTHEQAKAVLKVCEVFGLYFIDAKTVIDTLRELKNHRIEEDCFI
jgi:hypothetical protein